MNRLPKQSLSLSEKLKDNKQWAKDVIDHLTFYAENHYDLDGRSYARKLSNYQLYNNVLNQADFENECNPLGLTIGEFKDNIKPYNKTYNKIQVLLGEELKRSMNYRAVLVNGEGIRQKEVKRTELMRDYIEYLIDKEKERLKKKFEANNPMPQVDQESPESQKAMEDYQNRLNDSVNKVMDPKEIEKFMSTEYQEAREILVQRVLNYIVRKQNLKEKKSDAFKHGLIAGEEGVWVGIENGEPVCRILNPLGFFYHKSPEEKYSQNGEYAGYRTRMTPSEILDRYSTELTKQEIDRIEGDSAGGLGIMGASPNMINKSMQVFNRDIEFEFNKEGDYSEEGSYGRARSEDWEVTHVEWKSRAKVGFLTYVDEAGEEQLDLVSEDFPIPFGTTKTQDVTPYGSHKTVYNFPTGQKLEWHWIPEVWEGTRIGGDIYVNIRKKPNQHRSIENPWDVKLGYHIMSYDNMNAPTISMMDRMKPFQYLYFIVAHKLKRLIARDKGKAYAIDTTMIDEKLGLEKTLYYLEEMDIHFINPMQNAEEPGFANTSNITNVWDRSNTQHILNYVQLMSFIDGEIGDAAGVSKQREGSVGTYEAVTNTQQSIVQSSHITEAYFYKHDKLWETVLNSLVECAQEAWKDSRVTKQFVLDDLSRHVLDFSGAEIKNSDFSIFISDSVGDTELLNTLKQMALPILQNQGKVTDIVKIYKSLSSSELEREFMQEERDRERKEQQAQQAQQQLQQQQIQAQTEAIDKQNKHEWDMQTRELENDILGKQIEVFKFQQDLDMNNDGIPDPLQVEKLRIETKFKEKQLNQQIIEHKDKMAIEEKKIKAKPKTSK